MKKPAVPAVVPVEVPTFITGTDIAFQVEGWSGTNYDLRGTRTGSHREAAADCPHATDRLGSNFDVRCGTAAPHAAGIP